MTSDARARTGDLSANRHFLYSKTPTESGSSHSGEPPLPILPSEEDDPLRRSFPDLHTGAQYFEWAAAKAAPHRLFTALALRIDTTARRYVDDHERVRQLRQEAAEAIERACVQENGSWGLMAPDTFGCLLTGKDVASSLAIAKKLQEQLNTTAGLTLTIGLAGFPCLKYTPSDVLLNARKALDHASFLGPGGRACFDAVSLNISGDRCYDAGEIDSAIQEFRNALRLDAQNVNVLNSLGVCFGVRQDYAKALTAFQAALKINPEEMLALYNAGLVHLLMEQPDKALACWLKAAPLGKDVFELNFQAGKLLIETGRPEKGQKLIQRAARLKPDSAVVQRYLGDAFRMQRLLEDAIPPYKKALRLHPNDAHALSGLGRCYDLRNENLDIALAFCRQSVDITPDNGRFHMRLGRLLGKTGQYDEALKAFKQAESLGIDAREAITAIEERCVDKAS
ncbi:MAG TPA: tetratricopeptide repeat protein [Desulfosarcina sp.]|nr:tetratricopeptide repeat protein [Desulfosarcina sp.]